MKFILTLILLVILLGCGTTTQKAQTTFDGMWRLDKFEAYDSLSNRWTIDSTRVAWMGYILYDGQGHMGVHLIPGNYQDTDTNKNLDSLQDNELKELVKFYKSNFVYFANYTITGQTIDHNRLTATEPNNWGTTLTRDYDFKGDTLILTARETIGGKKLRLRWIKL